MANGKIGFFLVLLILAGLVIYFHAGRESVTEMRLMMDTMILIRAYGAEKAARSAIDRGFAEFARVEKSASIHLPDSEATKLNQSLNLEPSTLMRDLLGHTAKAFEQTRGFFDPTFAVLQKAYGFYDPNRIGRQPEEAEIGQLLEKTGLKKRVVFAENGNISMASGTILDYGGIAGGYAVKLAARAMRESGCAAFLIDDAGDIWFEGSKPDGSAWKISIRDPRDNSALAVIESRLPVAISTSGSYERFVEVDGKKLGHIMNPFNGRPVDYYQSVTVIASDPVDADVFSTAAFAMPENEALSWTEQMGVPALFLTNDNRLLINKVGSSWFKNQKQ
ncbi:MAG: FAD:protein FMN transferase [Candidatus Rifleibacteriota bacterium]